MSQAYDSENFFCTSIPKIISVSGNLSPFMKLCVNLNSAILRWSAVISNAIIGDPSVVFNVVVVGWIGVLTLSSMSWYVEYLMSDIAAPDSMRALSCFLAWTVIVGQSIMSATVTGSCVVNPPCSWESLLGEGSFSLSDLSPLLSWKSGHQNYNNPCVDLLFSLWCSSCGGFHVMIYWNVRVAFVNLILRICRIDVNMSGFGLWSGMMMSFCAQMIRSVVNVVCYSGIDGYNSCMWNLSIMSYSWGGGDYPYVVIWNVLYMNHDDLSCSVCGNVTVTWNDFAYPCSHGSVWNMTWHGGCCVVWVGDPKVGILCGQSITTWPYSSHSKHQMLGQFIAMCPCSRHWKQQSSSFDIMLTVDGGVMVAVSCCTGLSFSTSDIVLMSVCHPFS